MIDRLGQVSGPSMHLVAPLRLFALLHRVQQWASVFSAQLRDLTVKYSGSLLLQKVKAGVLAAHTDTHVRVHACTSRPTDTHRDHGNAQIEGRASLRASGFVAVLILDISSIYHMTDLQASLAAGTQQARDLQFPLPLQLDEHSCIAREGRRSNLGIVSN